MSRFETWLKSDLKKPNVVVPLHGRLFTQDNMSNLVGVHVYDNGLPVESLGGSVTGWVMRNDGQTVVINGTVDGGDAYIILPESAYAVPGEVTITLRHIVGSGANEVKTTLAVCTGYVYRTVTGAIIDPGEVVPDLASLLAQIETMEEATADANAAATAANTAASNVAGAIATPYANLTFPVAKGTYCTYNGSMYVAKNDIATSESWTASHWTNTNSGNEISEKVGSLSSAINYNVDNAVVEVTKQITWQNGYINTSGVVVSSSVSGYALVPMSAGESLTIATANSNITIIGWTNSDSVAVGDTINKIQTTTSSGNYEEYTYTAYNSVNVVVCVLMSNYQLHFYRPAVFIDTVDQHLNSLEGDLYTTDMTAVVSLTRNNSRLNMDGMYVTDTLYKVVYYRVCEGQFLKINSRFRFQFQNANTDPTSGTSVRVGDTYDVHSFNYVAVPATATYLAVCEKKEDTPTVYFVTHRVSEIEEKLLNDEELFLLLEKEKDNIREINLNASFFQQGYTSRRTSLKVFNPTTLKGIFANTPSTTLYDNVDIGRNTIYLVKGDRVITNIDSIYNNQKLQLPYQTFPDNGYRGVILSTFSNSNDTDNGSVFFGRENFDGKWRILDIGVTGYYELSFRSDVSYTNKAYIWHQKRNLVDHSDIVDITDTLTFYDGVINYNSSTGWSDNTAQDIGSAGRYQNKTVLISNLSEYVGKSLLISGLAMKEEEPQKTNVGNPAVIYYSDGSPTTYRLSYVRYVYDKDYAAFPIIDGYDIRLQFKSTACLPFVRVWIVDNDALYKNNLVNHVFYGKKILGFGDSYIAGQGEDWTWHAVLAARNACDYVKKGYGGAGLCFGANGTLLTHISDLDEDADIYFLCFGRNDNSTNIKIGGNDDELDTSVEWDASYLMYTATFKGAMNYLFNYIETRHPFAKIVTVTPWGFENNPGVTSGLSCLDYIDAMQEISKKWGITCFNAAGDAGIHVRVEAFRTQYFLSSGDQSHLNYNGHALMYKRAIKLLTNMLYDD